jgi:hypothetical protein
MQHATHSYHHFAFPSLAKEDYEGMCGMGGGSVESLSVRRAVQREQENT